MKDDENFKHCYLKLVSTGTCWITYLDAKGELVHFPLASSALNESITFPLPLPCSGSFEYYEKKFE